MTEVTTLAVPAFDPKEMEIIAESPGMFGPPLPVFGFPVTPKEAFRAALKGEAVWQVTWMENTFFCPGINPDNIARAFVFDGSARTPGSGGGKDMFGIEWEYVAQAGGSIVRPGKPFLSDANEWYDKLVWPDIDAWDWEAAAKVSEGHLTTDDFVTCCVFNGWYERLISFMDFEGAAMAMIDEDQTDAVKALFNKLSDLYIRIFDKYLTYFPQIDSFLIHDDWGSQRETFFSPATAKEMIVPYMKKVTGFIHSKDRFCELHSCGQLLKQVPNMIDAGWDHWSPQDVNDTHKIYELYGDKIVIGIYPDSIGPAAAEEEQRAAARDFANKFCDPKKPSIINFYSGSMLTRAYREELYRQSRINYSK